MPVHPVTEVRSAKFYTVASLTRIYDLEVLVICRFVQPQQGGILQRVTEARAVEVERSRPILNKVTVPLCEPLSHY